MNARATGLIVSVLWSWGGAATAGEDHAQHQHPTREGDEHAAHRAATDDAPTDSERAHVPPDPPSLVLDDLSNERMIELMQMEDDAPVGMLLFDQIEWRKIDNRNAAVWELQAWYGDDYNKLWLETEGERVGHEDVGRVELLWDRIMAPWWSFQAGVRHDFSAGPSRTWASATIQGLAPYFIDIEAAVYVGEEGRTAARFSGEYDLLITQRLILQPEIEFEWFGKDDPSNGIGAGLADAEIGLRLRYEIWREVAPYLGVHWHRKFGRTADMTRAAGHDAHDVTAVVGLRAWF